MSYQNFLEQKLKEEHAINHALSAQLQEEKKKRNKITAQLSSLRKQESQNKIQITNMKIKISQLQMQLNAIKNPHSRKESIPTQNMKSKTIKQQQTNPKAIFKQFISNSFPVYKQTAKKMLALIMHIQKHVEKNEKQRINVYYRIIGDAIKKGVYFLLGKKSQAQKNSSIAQKLVKKWNSSEADMKKLMNQAATLKIRQDKYLQQIQNLEVDNTKLITFRNNQHAKNTYYDKMIQIKGIEFANQLRKMLLEPEQFSEQQKVWMQELMDLFLKGKKNVKQQEKEITSIKIKNYNKSEVLELEQGKISSQQNVGLLKTKARIRKTPPVVKKNIYGYYEEPQFHNNQPNIIVIKHQDRNKAIQTIPQDLSIISVRPVLKLTVIDGKIKPQKHRHRLDFYVRIHYNKEQFFDTTVQNSHQPIWQQGFLIKGYDFPFFNMNLMNQSKGLRDFSVGRGKLHVAPVLAKQINVKNTSQQHQGRVRLSVEYPRGSIYEFTLHSIKIIKPEDDRIAKDTCTLKFPLNPVWSVNFDIGQQVKYTDKSFLILQGVQESVKVAFKQMKRIGSVNVANFAYQQGSKQIQISMGSQWSVILQGQVVLIVAQAQQPQKIQEQDSDHRYFSLKAPHPIVDIDYNNVTLPSHLKMPLVFKYSDQVNSLHINKQNILTHQTQQSIIEPLVQDQILLSHNMFNAPKRVYQIFIQTVEGQYEVVIKNKQKYYEKLLAKIVLECGSKQFSIDSSQLLENYKICINKNFKAVGFIKFKIGYAIHTNMLKMERPIRKPQVKRQQKEEDTIDEGEHYVSVQIWKAQMPSQSSTADYECVFGKHSTRKIMGNYPHWKETIILPYNQPIVYKIIQHSLVGTKTIYEGQFTIKLVHLKLQFVIINLNVSTHSSLFLGNVKNLNGVYELKVQKIHGTIEQKADWIGQIDPYLKFMCYGRCLYITEKVQGAGSEPVWYNDHFNAILPQPQLLSYVYDDDLIGKDDYLGQSTFSIPNYEVSQIQAPLLKEQRECGRIVLNGKFSKLDIKPVNMVNRQIGQLQYVYRVIVYRLQLNKAYLDDSKGHISYENKKQSANYLHKEQAKQIQVQYILYVTSHQIKQQKQIRVQYNREVKSLFSSSIERYGHSIIQITQDSKVVKTNKTQIVHNQNKGYIGNMYYLVQPVQTINYYYIEGWTTKHNTIQLQSDASDSITLHNTNTQWHNSYVFYHHKLQLQQDDKQELQEEEVSQKYMSIMKNGYIEGRIVGKHGTYTRKTHPIKKKQKQCNKNRKIYELSHLNCQFNNKYMKKDYSIRLDWQQYSLQYPVLQLPNKLLCCSSPQSLTIMEGKSTVTKDQFTILNTTSYVDKVLNTKGCLLSCQYAQVQHLDNIVHIGLQWLYVQVPYCEEMKNAIKYNSDFEGDLFTIILQIVVGDDVMRVNGDRVGNVGKFYPSLHLISKQNSIDSVLVNVVMMNNVKGSAIYKYQNINILDIDVGRQKNSDKGYIFPSHQQLLVYGQYSVYVPPQPSIQKYTKPYNIIKINQFKLQFINQKPQTQALHLHLTNTSSQVVWKIQLNNQGSYVINNNNTYLYVSDSQETKYNIRLQRIPSNDVQSFFSKKVQGTSSISVSNIINKLQHNIIVTQMINSEGNVGGKIKIVYSFMQDYQCHQLRVDRVIGSGGQKDKEQLWVSIEQGNTTKNIKCIRQKMMDSMVGEGQDQSRQRRVNKSVYNMRQPIVLIEGVEYGSLQVKDSNGSMLGDVSVSQLMKEYKQNGRKRWDHTYNMGSIVRGMVMGNIQECYIPEKQIQPIQDTRGIIKIQLTQFNLNLGDKIRIGFVSSMRTILSKPQQYSSKYTTYALLENNYDTNIHIYDNNQNTIAIASIPMPYYHNHTQVIIFRQLQGNHYPLGMCKCKTSYVMQRCVQIQTVQASSQINTQIFTQMTPYLQINDRYLSGIGIGQKNLFWKLGLIQQYSNNQYNIILKDKDMFFDDLIGSSVINIDKGKQHEPYEQYMGEYDVLDSKQKTGSILVRYKVLQQVKNIDRYYKVAQNIQTQYIQVNSFRENTKTISLLSKLNDNKQLLINQVNLDKWNNVSYLKMPLYNMKHINCNLVYNLVWNHKQNVKNNQFKTCKESLMNVNNQGIYIVHNIIQYYEKPQFNRTNSINVYIITEFGIVRVNQQIGNITLQGKGTQFLTIKPNRLTIIPNKKQTIRVVIVDEETGFSSTSTLSINMNKLKNEQREKTSMTAVEDITRTNYINHQALGRCAVQINKLQQKELSQMNIQTYHNQNKTNKYMKIKVKRATFLQDIQVFSKMDPYCIVKYNGDVVHKTSVQDNIGVNPVWNQSFYLTIPTSSINSQKSKNKKKLTFQMFDEEVTKDRTLGNGSKELTMIQQEEQFKIKLQKDSKEVGTLWISLGRVFTSSIVFTNMYSPNSDNLVNINSAEKHYKLYLQEWEIVEGKEYPVDLENVKIVLKDNMKGLSYERNIAFQQLLRREQNGWNRIIFVEALLQLDFMIFL